MANTLGMPSITPSNAMGRSGVGSDQVGHLGQGILGTIEEGVGGTSVKGLYYGTGSAFFQAPSMQRSVGDDIRSFNVKTFGSRGMVNIPRKWMSVGPTQLFFTYPINYAWAGPEYYARVFPAHSAFGAAVPADVFAYDANGTTYTNQIVTAADTLNKYVTNTLGARYFAGDLATEVRSGPNVLPTYFWSGGVGFAFLSMIELNMGGGGNIIFDRYSNFALIMASTPTISMREHIMRMAGGGLYYDHETDFNSLPVKFGWIPALTDEGTAVNRDDANATTVDNGENPNFIWAPLEWQIQVPLKTPETNFWHSLLARKPLDTSCFASDLQYTILFGNQFEFTDTGAGLANCPYYVDYFNNAKTPANIVADIALSVTANTAPYWHPNQIIPSAAATDGTAYFTQCDGWWTGGYGNALPSVSATGAVPTIYLVANHPAATSATVSAKTFLTWPAYLPKGYFYTGISPTPNVQAPNNPANLHVPYGLNGGTPTTGGYAVARNRIAANPRIWNNHYRVCNGYIYGGQGAPRPKMAMSGTNNLDLRYGVDAFSAAQGGKQSINYSNGFTRAEWRNQSLKLTNPALSARLPLQSTPNACVYYPFTYAFAQTYRIPPALNPFDAQNLHRWCSRQVFGASYTSTSPTIISCLTDTQAVGNRITQNIQMPANPVTSMIVGIYREKDRKYLGTNTPNTYSPVLFWNALNPVRCTLYDGGNILFDYTGPNSFLYSSLIDRPDVLKIPFRGGLCQQDPNNILPSAYEMCGAGAGDYFPDGAYKARGFRWVKQGSGTASHGHRNTPIHCTEWYNCHLLEFPFVMHEPLSREGSVQSTPSFAKTLLRLEFYLDATLKPHRGLDDMYDQTTQVPGTWYSGDTASTPTLGATVANGGYSLAPLRFTGAVAATNNVNLSVPSAYILDSVQNLSSYADERETTVFGLTNGAGSRTTTITNVAATMASNASSWNINDGGLMVHVTFCQNQVWVISPLRTTILSSRG